MSAQAQSTPIFISGIWKPGANITEPHPKSSKYIKRTVAGFLADTHEAAYTAHVEISPEVKAPFFMQVFFEDPLNSKKPFKEEAVIPRCLKSYSLTHGPAKGLQIYHDYRITVKVYQHKGDAEPRDVLVQSVRSYVDTRGTGKKLMNGIKQQ